MEFRWSFHSNISINLFLVALACSTGISSMGELILNVNFDLDYRSDLVIPILGFDVCVVEGEPLPTINEYNVTCNGVVSIIVSRESAS